MGNVVELPRAPTEDDIRKAAGEATMQAGSLSMKLSIASRWPKLWSDSDRREVADKLKALNETLKVLT